MIHSSSFWKNHFQHNLTKQRIDWQLKPNITKEEKEKILYSLKAWQLGETSDGKHLMAAVNKYAAHIHDAEYPEAVQLFIKEEQKHGGNLGRYIDLIGEQRAKKDWGDTLFRKIRYFNTSMELWTITVIIVESAAQVFYKALQDATSCALLKSICNDILIDEAHHIKFQNERLYIIFQQKSIYVKAVSMLFYAALFYLTIHAIWLGHRKALKAGGVSHSEFMKQMFYKFFRSMQFLHTDYISEPATMQLT
jgi:hypothetical protein